jgi:hypothetical protein
MPPVLAVFQRAQGPVFPRLAYLSGKLIFATVELPLHP